MGQRWIGGWALLAVAAACGPKATGDGPVQLLAAASIAPALAEWAADPARLPSNVSVNVHAGPSSTLALQVERGVPADLLVVADPRWIDHVDALGRVQARAEVATNQLVWIASRRSGHREVPAPGTESLALADPDHVPAGTHARAALTRTGDWAAWAPRAVRALDVRAALVLVARHEVELGIVYRSDADTTPEVRMLGPLAAATPVVYQAALLRPTTAAARAVFDQMRQSWVLGEGVQAALARAGFAPPEGLARPAEKPPSPGSPALGGDAAALRLSLLVGLLATLFALPLALPLAFWLARTRSRLAVWIDALVLLPMVLPPVVVGYFLLVLFGRSGLVPTGLPFTTAAAALAALVMGLPLMVRQIRTAFEGVDPALEQAAATLGAGPWNGFRRVTLPLAWRGVLAGTVLCFARSFGEFGATITFAGNIPGETRTLPLAIWTALQSPGGDGTAWRLTWLCVAVAVVTSLVGELLVRRARHGRSQ